MGASHLAACRAPRCSRNLLDLHLLDISGAELLEQLRGHPGPPSIPVVVLRAAAAAHTMDRLYAAGVRGYLTKPPAMPRFLQLPQEVLTA
jgi:CheY-like chemotaxis protein